MKTSALLITVVVTLHCAALGALFFIQGCGTTARTGTPPPATTTSMPPTTKEAVNYPPPQPAEKAPAAKSVSKESPAALETTEYVVRSGDMIGSIAKQYGASRSEVIELNKLADPNKLRVGQKLILPGRLKIKAPATAPAKRSVAKAKAVEAPDASAAPVAPAEVAAPSEPLAPANMEAPAVGKEYVVQKGDVLSRIAKKCGTKTGALREANKLKDDKLKVGQKLIIPEAAAAPAVSAAAPAVPGIEAPVVAPSMEIKQTAAPAAPVAAPMIIKAPAESAVTPAAVAAPAAAAAPVKTVANSGITHIVQPSEDLNSVAKLYAVTVDEIAELNQLGANRAVKVGQRLKIP